MVEVIEGRQQQLEEKITEIKKEQLENIERREELLRKIEEGNQLTTREEKRKHDQQKKLNEDLQSQVNSTSLYAAFHCIALCKYIKFYNIALKFL